MVQNMYNVKQGCSTSHHWQGCTVPQVDTPGQQYKKYIFTGNFDTNICAAMIVQKYELGP
jgi:hypothetical protein